MNTRRLSKLFALSLLLIFGKEEINAKKNNYIAADFDEIDSGQIYYGFNKVYPSNSQLSVINKFIRWSKKDPTVYLSVESHTDAIGNREINLKVSKLRANIVADYLKRNGVSDEKILVDWKGEDSPINENLTSEERKLNRRTVIKVVRIIPKPSITTPVVSSTSNVISHNIVHSIPTSTTVVKSQAMVAKVPVVKSAVVSERNVVPASQPVTSTPPTVTAPKEKVVEVSTREVVKKVKTKTIILKDLNTGLPINGELEFNSDRGMQSYKSDEKGNMEVPVEGMKLAKADIYAYGYFHKTEKIHPIPGSQTIYLKPIVKGNKLALENLFFESGKAILLSKSDEELENLYQVLVKNPNLKVEIGGHINVPFKKPEELSEQQMNLSRDRAKAVYDFLIKKGLDKKMVSYKGYGNSEMKFPEAQSEFEKAKNRRVEVKILEK